MEGVGLRDGAGREGKGDALKPTWRYNQSVGEVVMKSEVKRREKSK